MEELLSDVRRPSSVTVKNKAPAKVQITAEQLLREAWERKESGPSAVPKQQITDKEELQEYQRTERKQYEMRIVRNRSHTPLWIRYARWEESQEEFTRSRSVWERAIDNEYRNPAIWLGYAEMEMRHRFINHARNVLDRAVALLPRVDQLWLKYAHFEELLDQVELSRLVYSRWLKWMPGPSAFFAFIRFELRHGAYGRARSVYEELVRAHQTSHSYTKYAKFEERQGEMGRARGVYERSCQDLPTGQQNAGLFLSFARFEERRKQTERARAIYKYAIEKLGKEGVEVERLERAFISFEKQQGERDMVEEVVVRKKRNELQKRVKENGHDYDSWFDLLLLEEGHSGIERTKDTYEQAVTNKPPARAKSGWGRYMYLWIAYAVWAEMSGGTPEAGVEIYKRAVGAVGKRKEGGWEWVGGRIWVLYAQGRVRMGDVPGARKALGTGLGVGVGAREEVEIYRAYVELERGLGEFGRARKVYEGWVEREVERGGTEGFEEFAEFEKEMGELARAAGVLGVAVEAGVGGEEMWARYVAAEREIKGSDEMREIYERYARECSGARAWVEYGTVAGRDVWERGARELRGRAVEHGGKWAEELGTMVEAWVLWERSEGGDVAKAQSWLPKRVRRKRPRMSADGTHIGWEDYWVTIVEQEEDVAETGLLLLKAARRWKEMQATIAG